MKPSKKLISLLSIIIFVFNLVPTYSYAYSTGDDYPYKNYEPDVAEQWNFLTRECTSFVAWCLNSRNDISFRNRYIPGTDERLPSDINGGRWGHAYEWENAARQLGYIVDNTPAVGAVALWRYGSRGSWDTTGHVAWVKAVNSNGTIDIEQYTGYDTYVFQEETISSSVPSCYLHIKDIQPYTNELTVSARVTDLEVDISWSHISGATSYYTYTMNLSSNTVVYGANLGQAYSVHLGLAEGDYISYVTANMSDGTQKSVWTRYSVGKVVVQALPLGTTVDISWNDIGAESYYIYVQNRDTGVIPYGDNIGKRTSIHLGLGEGQFSAFVTAVFSSEYMKSGRADFISEKLQASTSKGNNGVFYINEPITLRVNASSIDHCILQIYRTATGGDSYKYWEGLINSAEYETNFSLEGNYSCHFLVTRGDCTVDSEWVSWTVKEPEFTVNYDANGGTNTPEQQIKEKDLPLKLSTIIPTRQDWYFLGWSESANAMVPEYLPGDNFTKDADTTLYAVWGQPDFILPISLETIEESAFENCSFHFAALSEYTTDIQSNAFLNCQNLKYILIPSDNAIINKDAFAGTQNLTILGTPRSNAEDFATQWGFAFVPTREIGES